MDNREEKIETIIANARSEYELFKERTLGLEALDIYRSYQIIYFYEEIVEFLTQKTCLEEVNNVERLADIPDLISELYYFYCDFSCTETLYNIETLQGTIFFIEDCIARDFKD